jgi:hypothetical protein
MSGASGTTPWMTTRPKKQSKARCALGCTPENPDDESEPRPIRPESLVGPSVSTFLSNPQILPVLPQEKGLRRTFHDPFSIQLWSGGA